MSRPSAILLLTVLGASVGCGSPAAAPSNPVAVEARTATLSVEGMTCGGCESAITLAAKKVPGVVSIEVSHEDGAARLTYDPARTDPGAVAKVITDLGYPAKLADGVAASAEPAPTAVHGIDPSMAAICEAGCAAQEDYDPADVVAQPGARVGDLTRCPVSGVVFRVRPDQPSYDKDGRTWFTCCGMCMGKLVEDPARFLDPA